MVCVKWTFEFIRKLSTAKKPIAQFAYTHQCLVHRLKLSAFTLSTKPSHLRQTAASKPSRFSKQSAILNHHYGQNRRTFFEKARRFRNRVKLNLAATRVESVDLSLKLLTFSSIKPAISAARRVKLLTFHEKVNSFTISQRLGRLAPR